MDYKLVSKQPDGSEAIAQVQLTDAELEMVATDPSFRASYRDMLARQALEPLVQEARKKACALSEDYIDVLLEIYRVKQSA